MRTTNHRDRFCAISDAEHAVASAGLLDTATVDAINGGFSNEAVETWMETAVDPTRVTGRTEQVHSPS